jgi:hypothetical protein
LLWPGGRSVEGLKLDIRGSQGRIEQHELLMRVHTRFDQVVEAVTERLTEGRVVIDESTR